MDPLATLHYRNASNRKLSAFGVTYGIPLPAGRLKADSRLAVALKDGKPRPVQTTVLERWADGSIKWLLLDFELPAAPHEAGTVSLVRHSGKPPAAKLSVRQSAGTITLSNDHVTVVISKKRASLFESYKVAGREMLEPGSDIILELPTGKRFYASDSAKVSASVVESGPQRVVVETAGRHTAGDGAEMFDFRIRYTLRPSEPGVLVQYKFTNREMPEKGVAIAGIRMCLNTALGSRTTKFIPPATPATFCIPLSTAVKENVENIAYKETKEAAKARYGNASDGKVVIRDLSTLRENLADYEHFLRPGNARTDMTGGLRAVFPYLGVQGDRASGLFWHYEMGQNFPKGIACDRNEVMLDIYPVWAGDCRIRRGISKEHDVFVAFFDGRKSHKALEDAYLEHEIYSAGAWGASSRPIELTMDPAYLRECQVHELHRWLPYDEQTYPMVEEKMGSLGRGGGGPGQLGMLDYGDHINADRSWAHNNENDAILQGIREYYRKQDPPALRGAIAKARHNATVDHIAFDPDPLRQGSMPAHCPEHTDGASYPSHMWLKGLLAAYCITGMTDLRDAAMNVGECLLRWMKQRPEIFYCDSRESGWPQLAFVRLYEFTQDRKWLDAAYEIFEHYRGAANADGEILHELPHGMGIIKTGYGEFISWRATFFLHEVMPDAKKKKAIAEFLAFALDKIYKRTFGQLAHGGWACNDLFPAWAGWAITGEDRYIEDNIEFVRVLLR